MDGVKEAVRNNALWCDAVSRAHGADGQFLEGLWISEGPTPPFFPNAITLSPDDSGRQLAKVEMLVDGGRLENWGVKDSYCTLELGGHGFQQVLKGEWILRVPQAKGGRGKIGSTPWRVVTTERELSAWEEKWHRDNGQECTTRVFFRTMLEDPRLSFWGAFEGTRIVAGAISFRTGCVVGVSNIFPIGGFGLQCIHEIGRHYPDFPLVGYEDNKDLEAISALGFQPSVQ